MSIILSAVEEFLEAEEWAYERNEDYPGVLRFGFAGKNANLVCYAQAYEEDQQLTIYAYLPNNVDMLKRVQAAEFLMRANYGLKIGNFEMDMDDGEARFKCSVDVEGGELTAKMVGNMVGSSVTVADRYYAGLMAVLFAGANPKQAIEQVESVSSIPDGI